ncbi:MAG TPA: Z1 domain-containing protein [Verrucomicrobiae bacterium]|nr:Z1 domain-containing protein [Verrucomicrobiae bacterium]
MGKHLDSYLEVLAKDAPDAVDSVKNTVNALIPKYVETFTHKEHIQGLLFGQVQSGKTGQMFGVIAGAADADDAFGVFILLTSDNVALQKQTYRRALEALDNTFAVCSEQDEVRFTEAGKRRPTLIILKKNDKILLNWRNILSASDACKGRPIFIVDDEADAASPNTKVNKAEQSTINTHLQAIQRLSTSSIYLQVTATPQALFLQSEESGWKPSFTHYFPPGKSYLGGEFFYSKPKPFTNRVTEDDELNTLLKTDVIADGIKRAIETYLITAGHVTLSASAKVCTFLVHPSSKIDDHENIRRKVTSYVKEVLASKGNDELTKRLKAAWTDLQQTKPDIRSFNEIFEFINSSPVISIHTLNSGPEGTSGQTFEEGLNIVIGGNTLGRGVTFKGLQTVYYCRSAKTPQADTFWQHCRMFGYDRDPLLMRVFMPEALFNLFSEINEANEVLIKQIQEGTFDDIQLVLHPKIKPTRKAVIDQSKYGYIVGGVNYFPPRPDQNNVANVDSVVDAFVDGEYEVSIDDAILVLKAFSSDLTNDWSVNAYINALESVKASKAFGNTAKLVIRRGRDIKRGTGTLLSPTDRSISKSNVNQSVIILYKLLGQVEKGWDGAEFWVPNIKLPYGKVFHRID